MTCKHVILHRRKTDMRTENTVCMSAIFSFKRHPMYQQRVPFQNSAFSFHYEYAVHT